MDYGLWTRGLVTTITNLIWTQLGYELRQSWIDHKMVETAVVCMDYRSTGGCFKRFAFISQCVAIRLPKLNLTLAITTMLV